MWLPTLPVGQYLQILQELEKLSNHFEHSIKLSIE